MNATPNPGDFEVYDNWARGEVELACPECEAALDVPYGCSISQLIAIATAHTRLAHPPSAPATIVRP